jgi:hypothetical protein
LIDVYTLDPFCSSSSSSEESIVSGVDSKIARTLLENVYENQTDSNQMNSLINSARSRVSKIKISVDSGDINRVSIGNSKKRPRKNSTMDSEDPV